MGHTEHVKSNYLMDIFFMDIRSKLLSLVLIPKLILIGLMGCFFFFAWHEAKTSRLGDVVDILRWDIRLTNREFREVVHGRSKPEEIDKLLNKVRNQLQILEDNHIDMSEVKTKFDIFIKKMDSIRSHLDEYKNADPAEALVDQPTEDLMWSAYNLSVYHSQEAQKDQFRLMLTLAITVSVLIGASFIVSILLIRSIRQEILRNQELSAIVKFSQDAIMSLTYDAIITNWNPAAEKLFGYTSKEVIGQPVSILWPVENDSKGIYITNEMQRGCSVDQCEVVRRRKDGSLVDVSITVSPIKDAGRTIGTSAIIRDITERRKHEAILQKLADNLVSSNQNLSRFVYFVSHDLREPARMVACYLKMLSEKVEMCGSRCINGNEIQELVEFGVSGAKRMEDLLDSLLEYSRLDGEISLKDVEMCPDVINIAKNNLKVAIDESEAEINVYCDNPDPNNCWHCVTKCDPIQMILVFQNLMANAIKYRRDGVTPRITITAKHLEKEWQFCIEDNGIGIPKEHLNEHLFEVFKRLHSRDKYPGSGIGLASCKQVIERHGGKIWAESEYGVGSKFFFTIPY